MLNNQRKTETIKRLFNFLLELYCYLITSSVVITSEENRKA